MREEVFRMERVTYCEQGVALLEKDVYKRQGHALHTGAGNTGAGCV